MEQAKNGVITAAMQTVAGKEGLTAEEIRLRVAAGSIVIPANHNHTSLSPEGVGLGLKT
jgi:phosphomethylpyrimidine synthase